MHNQAILQKGRLLAANPAPAWEAKSAEAAASAQARRAAVSSRGLRPEGLLPWKAVWSAEASLDLPRVPKPSPDPPALSKFLSGLVAHVQHKRR